MKRANATALALTTGLWAASAWATPYRVTAADRTEIDSVLHRFFDAARDGHVDVALALTPTAAERQTLWQPDSEAMMERHQAAVERDVRALQERFAGGAWVGIGSEFAAGSTLELTPCGRFAVSASQCVMGPIIEWRVGAGGELQHMRVDKLVRINGHWRVWDPRI